jgi:hypothetical protein
MARRHAIVGLVVALAWSIALGGTAAAHPDRTSSELRGRLSQSGDVGEFTDHHGLTTGHLPPTEKNVELVGRLQLTEEPGGIADVGYFKGYAYLNATFPECAAAGGPGGGVHVVDISDPSNPRKVGFLPSEPNAVPGEGIHVMEVDTPFFKGDLLLHNNESCSADPATLGFSMWDVTNPLAPKKLGQFGDSDPEPFLFSVCDPNPAVPCYHDNHSVQGFTQPGKAFAVSVDNEEAFGAPFKDVDIFDITNPAQPKLVAEQGLEDWPGAQGSYANGDAVNHHDMQFKRIGGHDFIAVSYWDAGQVILNVDNPANPTFVTDSNYLTPDPETGFPTMEGNSHESYWSSNNQFLISTDEDFSAYRTSFEITTGANAGPYGAGEFGFTPPVADMPGGQVNGPTIFGGRGCTAAGPNAPPPGVDITTDPAPPPASAMTADPGEEKTVVFSRGGCFFSTKIAAGQDLGYDVVIIGQSHGGSRTGLLPDSFTCGGQGHDYDEQIPAICTGHRAMHLLFNDPPQYSDPAGEGLDIPLGTLGEEYSASTEFDGWGYVNLHDATKADFPILDTYAVFEGLHEGFAQNFGTLSVHEIKTDPRPNVNLGYIAYYAAGLRVIDFSGGEMQEVGRWIGNKGNDFWGVFPIGDETAGHGYPSDQPYQKPLLLLSDRDFGLYIVRYTGSAGACGGTEVTALGTAGADSIAGTRGKDVVKALGGNDTAKGAKGRDRLCGDEDRDVLRGGPGRDLLVGGPGRDRCVGGPGKDRFRGCERKKR